MLRLEIEAVMAGGIVVLGTATGAVAAALAVLFAAVRRGWFARRTNGFVLALILTVAGVGLATAVLLGAWAYQTARAVLFEQQVLSLGEIGAAAETDTNGGIRVILAKLRNIAATPAIVAADKTPQAASTLLEQLQAYNPRLLQLTIYDPTGRIVARSSAAETPEPPNLVGNAFALEGKPFISEPYLSRSFHRYVLYMSTPIRARDGSAIGVLTLRYDFQSELSDFFGGVHIGQTGHIVMTDWSGRILAHPDASRIGEDISNYAFFREAQQYPQGWDIARNRAGVERLFVHRLMASPATINSKPLLLLTELDAAEATAPIRAMGLKFLAGVAVLVGLWALFARAIAGALTRPMGPLLAAVRRVQDNDLTVRAAVAGRDEFSRFAAAFNSMVQGLAERDRVKQLFGRYVTTQVSEQILAGGADLGGRSRNVTILFSDIRGFTAMAEGMSPPQVVELLNEYFTEMVDAVFEHGGVLDKFIGDGMLATFGALDDDGDHARRAVMAGLRMKSRLAKMNGDRAMHGLAPIHIGIGVHTDDVIVGNIGSRKRLEYTVIGDGVNTCSRVESMNKEFGTTLLITDKTHAATAGAFECREMPVARLKGKSHGVQLFEVISARAAPAYRASTETPALCR